MSAANILYGKVATRRDFIAVATPPAFLSVWEPWVHSGVSASREALRDRWAEYYLTAPIWRFWLGAEICGVPVLGAFMPSIDGIGRHFPLTFAVVGETRDAFVPPEINARSDWFAHVEDFLLASLAEKDHGALLRDLADVPAPEVSAFAFANCAALDAECFAATAAEEAFPAAFAGLRVAAAASAAASSSFFWTLGGEGFPPRALASRRLPAPRIFSLLLTGAFDCREVQE